MRVKSTLKNAVIGTSMQLLSMIFSFITRGVFARVLTVEYLGLESVFLDVINMLSIAEMGFATAITYSLYTPIRDQDYIKINSIMKVFKRVYEIIGTFMLVMGLLIAPLMPKLFDNLPSISENIYFVFIIFLLNSVIGYFYSFKQTLIISYQKDYIVQSVTKIFMIISNIIQIVTLIYLKNFIIYLLIKIITVFCINIYLSKKADKMFPFLNIKEAEPLKKDDLISIKKNIGAMFLHKIGYRIVFSTDNIFISFFSGVANAGRFSNYDLIARSVALLIDMVLNSSVASVGNLIAENDNKKSESIFNHIFFLNFILYSFSSTILMIILNDFINLWIGEKYQLGLLSVVLIVLNFFVHGMRRTVIIFRDSWGLFYKDRYKPILEILTNIIGQYILGRIWGLNGILVGTSLSIILSSFWIEPLVLYKFGFKKSSKTYFLTYFRYFVKTILVTCITFYVVQFIAVNSIVLFLTKLLISIILSTGLLIAFTYKEKSFTYCLNLIATIKR